MISSQKVKGPLAGFTLIELLIALTIFALLSSAIYATFSSGLTVWRRAKETKVEQRRDLLSIEKLSRELRQAFNFKDIPFYGSKNEIRFPEIVDSEITRVTYFFDADKKILLRSSDRLADIIAAGQEELASKSFPYLSRVDKLSLSYFYFDIQKKAYLWKEDWEQDNLPLAVKLDIATKDGTYATTIFIPTA